MSTSPWVLSTRPSWAALLLRLCQWPALIFARRDLLATSVKRELEARVRGTALGWLWLLAQPLLLFAVYAFLFTTLLGVRIGGEGVPAGAMGVYMFTGTLVWSAFADALTRSSSCIVDHGSVVKSVRFPAELLPLQVALSSCVTFCIGAVAYCAFAGLSGVWPLPSVGSLAWVPLLLILQLLLCTGVGLVLASVNVLWRDTGPFLSVALTVWMFATPVFWIASPELLPGVAPYIGLVEANPAASLVQLWRYVLMGDAPAIIHTSGFGDALVHLSCWSVGAFAVGSLVFYSLQRHLADEV